MADPAAEQLPLPVAVVPPKPGGPEVAAISARTGRFELPKDKFFKEEQPASPEPPAGEKPASEAPATPPADATSATPPSDAKSEKADAGDDETPGAEKPKTLTPEEKQARRLNRAFQKAAEEKARRELAERELERLRSAPRADPATAAPSDGGPPRLDQFDDIEKYAEAREKYAIEHDRKAREAEAKQKDAETAAKRQQDELAAITSSWEEKAERGADKYDDWAAKVGNLKPVNHLIVAIMEAENGDEIAYHLATNPAEANRIAALSPRQQVAQIGRLSERLEAKAAAPAAAPAPPAKTPSKAPPPIAPVSGTSAVIDDDWKPGDPHEKFLRMRNKELGRRQFPTH